MDPHRLGSIKSISPLPLIQALPQALPLPHHSHIDTPDVEAIATPHSRSPDNSARMAPSPSVFDEDFWQQYLENYRSMSVGESHGCLPVNPKKYHHYSSAVTTVRSYFDQLGLPVPSHTETCAVLKSPFVNGDVVKAFHFIRFFQSANEGYFLTNSPIDKRGHAITYQGAENWENVMCYLDALLFAMFANMEAFEPILFISNAHINSPNKRLVDQLSALLRVYTTLLRSGNLITTDVTIQICETLTKLGFIEATSHTQQDSAALFVFLTEMLQMPLLTFKIDIKHGGKFSKEDDQKISKERLLFVSIPEDTSSSREASQSRAVEDDTLSPSPNTSPPPPDSEVAIAEVTEELGRVATRSDSDEEPEEILLEECLEHYFNNSISVKRELERRATSDRIEVIEGVIPTSSSSMKSQPSRSSLFKEPIRGELPRTRSSTLSIWSESPAAPNSTTTHQSSNDDTSTIRGRATSLHEVSLPAWMFLRLLPFYTDDNDTDGTAKNSKEFVNRRPILPICLKRYEYDVGTSTANRSKRRVVIPPVINLPQFVAEDDNYDMNNYKLILESAVCHRGTSISSGHFVAATRRDNNNTSLTLEEGYSAKWLLFDDMNKKHRIKEKTFKEIFDNEWPYILFYRLVSPDDPSEERIESHLPIVRPHGSKSNYWSDLSPITSGPQSGTSPHLAVANDEPKRRESSASNSSIPLPDIAPTDPSFVDVRNRYYWYVPDKDHNYYKELPRIGVSGDSEITMSPQFRRNSQWSGEHKVMSINTIPDISLNAPSYPAATPTTVSAPAITTSHAPHSARVHHSKPDTGDDYGLRERQGFLGRSKSKKVTRQSRRRRDKYRDEKCVLM
ncbi:hypothetical protein DIURU_005044 [Diutina rugosa]|uniref:ubiquitinyl hydrolase 1 n=1 Tax=Diutina rugosa TaxID=5481 RepID=A0A642UFX7_DIURU|nr:uncharacterized protein DIURU_005044 [Diutina rugosa]KAA8898189.1 hypothetical protein DIURU_005044 [Diutina rugosa]